jgi:hypothetical protein
LAGIEGADAGERDQALKEALASVPRPGAHGFARDPQRTKDVVGEIQIFWPTIGGGCDRVSGALQRQAEPSALRHFGDKLIPIPTGRQRQGDGAEHFR